MYTEFKRKTLSETELKSYVFSVCLQAVIVPMTRLTKLKPNVVTYLGFVVFNNVLLIRVAHRIRSVVVTFSIFGYVYRAFCCVIVSFPLVYIVREQPRRPSIGHRPSPVGVVNHDCF